MILNYLSSDLTWTTWTTWTKALMTRLLVVQGRLNLSVPLGPELIKISFFLLKCERTFSTRTFHRAFSCSSKERGQFSPREHVKGGYAFSGVLAEAVETVICFGRWYETLVSLFNTCDFTLL